MTDHDRLRRILHIHQQRAVRKLLATNGFSDCNGHWTPQPTGSKLQRLDPESNPSNGTARTLDSDGRQRYQSIVGSRSLVWLLLCTRPDLAFTVSMLSKFSSTPTTEHLSAATYTLRYLRHMANLAIQYYSSDSEATIPAGYTDSDIAEDPDDRKSTSGYVFMLAGGAITWCARKQPLVAFSTVEAEYIRASDAAKEAIWVRSLYVRILYGKILYKHAEQCPTACALTTTVRLPSLSKSSSVTMVQSNLQRTGSSMSAPSTSASAPTSSVMPRNGTPSSPYTSRHPTCSPTS